MQIAQYICKTTVWVSSRLIKRVMLPCVVSLVCAACLSGCGARADSTVQPAPWVDSSWVAEDVFDYTKEDIVRAQEAVVDDNYYWSSWYE